MAGLSMTTASSLHVGSSLRLTSTVLFISAAVAATATCALIASAALYGTTTTKPNSTSRTKRPGLVRASASIRAYLNFHHFGSSAPEESLASESKAAEADDDSKRKDDSHALELEYSGLLIGDDLFAAIKTCKERVDRISRECRADNRRFRDIEFDILDAQNICLHNLTKTPSYAPTDIRRVTELYDQPKLYMNGADPNDIIQGALGDCWFLSALSALSTVDGLVSKFCVARDEEVGVYAFIFRKHGKWVPVVIDDLLFTEIPKFDFLYDREKKIYKNDRVLYNQNARKGGEGLYFAKSGKEGETWVPLIEKAFAKLHGDFGSLHGGLPADAFEDLTGGITESWKTKDILDTDRWWDEELCKAGQDRFFDVHFPQLSAERSGESAQVEGLYGGHAYTVLRARQVKDGRKFVVVRNPWGSEVWKWKGRWSDGSKEWNRETMGILQELGHTLGDQGIFVMEYCDFLDCFKNIQRTALLDHTWRMSQYWLSIPPKPDGYPWSFGEAIFHFTLKKPSKTHIVLSQIDRRSFEPISGRIHYYLDFVVCKRGEDEWRGVSPVSYRLCRNVACDLDLEEGEYVVFPRIQRQFFAVRSLCYYKDVVDSWDQRKLSRVLTHREEALSIAQNADLKPHHQHLRQHYASTYPNPDEKTLVLAAGASESQSVAPDSTTPAAEAPREEQKDCPPPQCTLDELSKDPEDREILVIGLQVYAQEGCIAEVSGEIPSEAMLVYPVAAV